MDNRTIRQRLLQSTMIGGTALMAMVAAPAAIMVAPTTASAQDYTSGTLQGTVVDQTGNPVTGANIIVRSVAQGVTRNVITNARGDFRLPLIPIGAYDVVINASGYKSAEDQVSVRVGTSSDYDFIIISESSDVTQLGEIVVTGARARLDFAKTTKGATIDISELVERVPVGRDITSVTLLAPGVITGSGSAQFRGLPSIGGSTVAENAFYLNGLNITNFDTYVGGATVPFDFYQTVEVKTGGYPAEFGRATGGVINAVTKSGTNDFMFALHGNWRPHGLDEVSPDTETVNGVSHNKRRQVDSWDYTVEIGGPIIKDRIFAYGLYQGRDLTTKSASNTTYQELSTSSPFWGAKVDAYITDEHRLEFTYFDTKSEQENLSWSYDGAADKIGAPSPNSYTLGGGQSYIARYTGNVTNWLTVSAAYGVSEDRSSLEPSDVSSPVVVDSRYTVFPDPSTGGTRPAFIRSTQRTSTSDLSDTRREFYRIDADVYFSLMGNHHVRFGYDRENNTLNHVNELTGGRRYTLRQGTGANLGYGVPLGQQFIQVQYQRLGGLDIESVNDSFYIQDAWNVTDNFSLQLGLRYDSFMVESLGGEKMIELKDNWGPRFGFTWDPIGSGRDKFYGSYGRYFIPPASNMAFRGADYGFSEFFMGTGPNGEVQFNGEIPQIGTQITAANNPQFDNFVSPAPCPAGGFSTEGEVACTISMGLGIPERAFSKTPTSLKATNEDEFIIGYERSINELWSLGAAVTYRKLNNVSEDTTLDDFVVQYCKDNGYDVNACANTWYGGWQYIVLNPGQDMDIYTRGALPGDPNPTCFGPLAGTPSETNCGTLIHLTAEQLKFPKPKREYLGLELTFDRAFDGVWALQGSYVLSKSVGNYEGTVLSDAGGATQDDAGSTQLYDYVGLTDYQDGPLPNHRLHQFKLFGSYQLLDNLIVGGNMRVASPKKFGCLGVHPTDGNAAAYGSASRYCAGQPGTRGSRLESDWVTNFDLSLRYTVPSSLPGDLVLRADIFNLFNFQRADELDEVADDDGATMLPTYGNVFSYQQPRYVRIGFDWKF